VARERPHDISLSQFYKSESTETESTTTVNYPKDAVEYIDDESTAQSNDAENRPSVSVRRVESEDTLGGVEAHPDPELDDFLEVHGFGDSDDESDDESEGGDEDGWMAFDSSPFGVSRFAAMNDDSSGSTAPPLRDGKHSPESPTSITDFSTNSSAQEKAKVMWWSREHPEDDVLSI